MGFSALLGAADRVVQDKLGDTTVTITPGAGVPVDVTALYDAPHERVSATDPGVTETAPSISVLLADFPNDPTERDFTATINGVEYEPREVQPDGKGRVVIFLREI
jgi:hypothetical protein